jgi:Tfp pilus assembly protein PilO
MVLLVTAKSARSDVTALHHRLERLQERLISAQITTSRLDQVQSLIEENLAYSAADSLTRGASMPFLKALTLVLDDLGITLTSLQPLAPDGTGRFVETPYRVEMHCSYHQLCELVNKMEKSPRLISITSFTLANDLENYFNDTRTSGDRCAVVMELTTLTLVRD